MLECKICRCDIEYEGLDNVSPFAGCPICERCIDDMMCEACCDDSRLFYVESLDAILCEDCLLKRMEKEGVLHSSKKYYSDEWREIGDDDNREKVIEYLKERYEVQEKP